MPTDESREKVLSFLDHLEELRQRLIWALLAFAVGVVAGYIVAPLPLDLLVRPIVRAQERAEAARAKRTLEIEIREDGLLALRGDYSLSPDAPRPDLISLYAGDSTEPIQTWKTGLRTPIIYLRPMDPFVIRLKAAVVLGIIFSLPMILYQIWAFVSPGLLPREKKLAVPLIAAGSVLFPAGALFAYFLLELALMFFGQFIMESATVQNDAREYLGFVLSMLLAFGVVFELPLAVVLATRLGLVSIDWLASRRRYIFLALLVFSAVITPTGDPITLMAMAIPLQLLFELSLIASKLLGGKRDSEEEESDTRGDDEDEEERL